MYTLLNYSQGSGRQKACLPEMRSTIPGDLLKEIKDFVEDGHSEHIKEILVKTEYHIDLQNLTEWMSNPNEPLHIVTETYTEWEPIIFELIKTEQIHKYQDT